MPEGNDYLASAQKSVPHYVAPMFQFLAGYGELKLASIISAAAGCRVLIDCPAQAGSTIDHWNNDTLVSMRSIPRDRTPVSAPRTAGFSRAAARAAATPLWRK